MPHPKVKIADNSGNEVAVTSNALDVNIAGGADINIGDVEILGHATFSTYPQFTVGTSLVQLSGETAITAVAKEMIIQADADNSSFVMVGDDAIAANETDGIRIDAGDTLILPMASTVGVYFRSDSADQKVNVSLLF